MALAVLLMLIVGGFSAGSAHNLGWGPGIVALRFLAGAAIVALVFLALTWWRARQIRRTLTNAGLDAG